MPAPDRAGEDWPRFLGLAETGVSGETELLQSWPKQGPPLIWEKKVGTGYSAPSVLGNRLVLHHRIGDSEIIECMQADTGATLWKKSYSSAFKDPYGYNNGPRCSPILTDSHCYTLGAEGMLSCVTLQSGETVWRRDLQKEFQLPEWFFGVGCTPLLDGDRLIVLVGGQPNSAVVAFDKTTGKTLWENGGKSTWDGAKKDNGATYSWQGDEMIVSYSSPIIATIHGQRHLLCLLRHGLASFDPKTGKENFHYWFRPKVHESVNAARPVVVGDKIFLSAAYRLGSALVQVNSDGKSVTEIWRNPRNLLTHWSTAIHHDGSIFGFSGRHEREGELRCLDLQSGDVIWKTSGFDGEPDSVTQNPVTGAIINRKTKEEIPWPFFGRGSKIQIGNRFLILGERGTLALGKVSREKYEEICRTSFKQISYPAWTAPVLSRKRLYLRDEDALICLDLKP